MLSTQSFVCVYSSATSDSGCASFTKDIPEERIQRSSVLKQVAQDDKPKLVLPLGADVNFLDAWVQLADLWQEPGSRTVHDVPLEFIIQSLQVSCP
jgi:hypothetical protein